MMVCLLDLPTEVLLQILSHSSHASLADVCATSRTLHALVLPILYTTIRPGSLTGTLRLFRRLAKGPSEAGCIGMYSPLTTGIYLPKIPATHEVKTAIALALSQCIQLGYFPNLRNLRWPFTYVRRGFLEEHDAARFDEPVYQAMLEEYDDFGRLVVDNASHVSADSAVSTNLMKRLRSEGWFLAILAMALEGEMQGLYCTQAGVGSMQGSNLHNLESLATVSKSQSRLCSMQTVIHVQRVILYMSWV